VFKFFLLRLLENLMFIATSTPFSLNLPPTHPYSNLLTEVNQDLTYRCIPVQFSELKRYHLESVPI
jgi:hypothetical protein